MNFLPAEILIIIFSYSDVRDLKSARFVCKHWKKSATFPLFSQVCLSKLTWDRNAFFSIAAHPDLAGCVRKLVWYELEEEASGLAVLSEKALEQNKARAIKCGQEEICIFHELADHISDSNLFWYSARDDSFDDDSTYQGFRDQFYHALESMPQLHTIATKPMPPCHPLTKSNSIYPLTAQLLQRDTTIRDALFNHGFFQYLMPVVGERAAAGKSTITRLCYQEESAVTALDRFDESYQRPIFENLTHVDLCVRLAKDADNLYDIKALLQAAHNLVSLRLSSERPSSERREADDQDANLDPLSFYWPKLHSLRIENIKISPYKLGVFLKKHATSLRNVAILANIPAMWYDQLRKPCEGSGTIPQLERLVIIPVLFDPADDFPDNKVLKIREEELLDFVNNGTLSSTIEFISMQESVKRYICTYPTTFAMDEWTTVVSDEKHVRGALYGSPTEPQVTTEERLHAESPEIGQNMATSEEDDDSSEWEEDSSSYTAEAQASESKRLLEAPGWVREELHPGHVAYREAYPEEESNHTEMWSFKHHNGEYAYGEEPLEFWEDWEGSEAGDIAEPMPLGWQFRKREIDTHPDTKVHMHPPNCCHVLRAGDAKEVPDILPFPGLTVDGEIEDFESWVSLFDSSSDMVDEWEE